MPDKSSKCTQIRQELAQAHARIAELEAALTCQSGAAPNRLCPWHDHRRMEAILRGISDLCVAVDREWRMTYVNPQAEAFYGMPAEALVGRIAWELFPVLVGTEFYHKCHRAMEHQETAYFEVPSHLRPGRWLEFRIGPTYEGIAIFGTDITARKHAEQQLKILNETLEQRVAQRTAEAEHRAVQLRRLTAQLTQAEQRERQQLAQVLHDHLQQLLVAAKLNLGSLCRHTRSEALREGLGRVNDMLVAALEASRSLTVELSPPVLRKGSLRDVLHWLAGWIRNRHGLTVHVQADGPLETECHGIRVLLFQAVRELLFNVVKHAGVEEATVQLCQEGESLRLVVADEGLGFDAASPAQDEGKGTGFGLFSIRERLELVGGRLEIASTPGRGTRMTLLVPLRLAEDAEPPAEPQAPALPSSDASRAPAEPPTPGRRIRVLLADDHQLVQDGLRRLLAAHEDIEIVAEASDGQQAVDLAVRCQPDVVLMDIDMPCLDGVEATRRISAQVPTARVIGLSMLSETTVARSMIEAGAVRYLTKTSSPEVLIEAVRLAGNL